MVAWEGIDPHPAGLKLHLSKQVLKSRFPCKMPLAFFTPTFWFGCWITEVPNSKPQASRGSKFGTPGGNRTPDLWDRSPLL